MRGQLAGSLGKWVVEGVDKREETGQKQAPNASPGPDPEVPSNIPGPLGGSWQTLCRSPFRAGSYQLCPGPGTLNSWSPA